MNEKGSQDRYDFRHNIPLLIDTSQTLASAYTPEQMKFDFKRFGIKIH